MAKSRIVHVIGTGTIGEPLIGLLTTHREQLGIDEISFHKRTPLVTDRSKVVNLIKRGARLACDRNALEGFKELGMTPTLESEEAIERAAVVIDCTPSGVGSQNKADFYEKYTANTLGFIAQGSEFGFGKMYARGINDRSLKTGEDQFIHVVSCNTHNLAALIDSIAIQDGGPDNLVEGRFLCVRRANDISQDGSFCPSPQVGKHKDTRFGTHHARDAWHLFSTLGYDLNLYSSAIKVNSQYMHLIQFNIRVKKPTSVQAILDRMRANDRIALTEKISCNQVFSFGRDYGHYGRILNQMVLSTQTLTVNNGTEVIGFTFTPQDGNPLLSSVAATCWYLDPRTYEDKIQCLRPYFFDEV